MDSLRGCETTTTRVAPTIPTVTEEPPPTTTTTDTGPAPQEDAPADWPTGELRGVLTYVDADDCRVRTIGLTSGRPRPPTRFVTDCRGFWAPKVGHASPSGRSSARASSASRPRASRGRRSGRFRSALRPLPSGAPTADTSPGATPRTPASSSRCSATAGSWSFCPIAYTLDERLARAAVQRSGRRRDDGRHRPGRRSRGPGSGRTTRWCRSRVAPRAVRRRRVHGVDRPARDWTGSAPVVSPDTCLVAVPTTLGFAVVSPVRPKRRRADPRVLRRRGLRTESGSRSQARTESCSPGSQASELGERLQWPATAAQLEWRG